MFLTVRNKRCNYYIQKKIKNYKENKKLLVEDLKPLRGIEIRRKIHPVIGKILKIKSMVCGLTYEFIGKEMKCKKNDAVIYAATHIGKFDYEMIVEACDIFAYAFAGDWELMYGTIDDYFFRINGVIYVDTEDKEDRRNSLRYMKKLLKEGISIIIFPEGIWNLTENLPVMKCYPGVIQASKECRVPIVPIAIEQEGKHFFINVGKEIDVSEMEEKEGVKLLRDILASLRWEIWEKLPQGIRVDISPEYYNLFLRERLAEWKPMTYEIYSKRRYRDKVEKECMKAYSDLENIKSKDF